MNIRWLYWGAFLLAVTGISFFVSLKLMESFNSEQTGTQQQAYDIWPEVIVGKDTIACDGKYGTGGLQDCKTITIFKAGKSNVFGVRNPEKRLDTLEIIKSGMKITSSNSAPTPRKETGAVFIHLDQDMERYYQNKQLVISVWVKPDPDNPSPRFAVTYSTNGKEKNGWKKAKAKTKGFKRYKIRYKTTTKKQVAAGDFIGFWADVEGKGRAIIVKKIEISVE